MTHRLLMTIDAIGGVWQYGTELARALRPFGYDVVLALVGPAPSVVQRDELAASGIALIETGLELDWLAADTHAVERTGEAIAALARECRADLVQLNQPAFAGAAFGVPTVAAVHSCVASWWEAVEHGPLPAAFAWQTDLVCRGLLSADVVVCPSRAFADVIKRTYHLPSCPLAVHNGRTPLALAAAKPQDLAFTAGRLWDRGKNVATLDRAAARLGIPFKAAGPLQGPHGERIKIEHLHVLGPVDEHVVAGCLSVRPIFVSAARYEPFGLAVLEAAQAGCALVLSDIPTFRELWDGAASFVAAEDAAGFTAAIEALAGDIDTRLAHGDRARRRAARFSAERNARAMASLYDGVLSLGGRAAA